MGHHQQSTDELDWVLDWVISNGSWTKRSTGFMSGVPMYWNWVLDWVTFICIDKKSWDTTSKVLMNRNWALDWVISDGSWTK